MVDYELVSNNRCYGHQKRAVWKESQKDEMKYRSIIVVVEGAAELARYMPINSFATLSEASLIPLCKEFPCESIVTTA